MRKILPIFIAVLLFLIVYPTRVLAVAPSINDVLNSSRVSGSPLGDCIGSDGKHFQATKEVCEAFNKAWGKSKVSFSVGAPSPVSPASAPTNVPINDVIATSLASNSPTGDCIGPDKKHFEATKEVCDAFNKDWGKSKVSFSVGVPVPLTASLTLTEAIVKVESGSVNQPLGDCVGPDKKHFQTIAELCDAFNKTWGKTSVTFQAGLATSPSTTTSLVSITEAISKSEEAGSPKGDCIGPDKKHFDATKEVCEALNKSWGKTSVPFTPGVSTGSNASGKSGGSGGSSGGGSSASNGAGGGSGGSSGSSGSNVSSGGSSGSSVKSSGGGKSESKEKKNDNKKEKKDNKD